MKKIMLLMSLLLLVIVMAGCNGDQIEGSGELANVDQAKNEIKEVSIMTPYLSSVTTNEMVETMKTGMETKGWKVTIVDAKGDVATLASRMEDVVSAKVDAIVIVSTDPNQVLTQIENAVEAGIPVFGCDSGFVEGMSINATSDNYAMGELITNYLFDKLGNEGKIIALTHRPHPGVLKRSEAFDDILAKNPDIELITEQHVEVPGPIENSRKTMESLILANSEVGSISAVWCAWDEPAIGVSQALADAGRDEVIVVGVDGNSQAVEMIEGETNLIATVKQNFSGMAEIVIGEMENVFNGIEIEKGDKFAPATIVD